MTPEAIATLLLHASLAVTAALLLCFALRLPLRHAFGARIAYGVWLLVPAALAAACMPRPRGQAIELAVAAAPAVAATPAEAAVPLAALATPFAWSPLLVGLWAAGACLAAGLLALRQRRYVRSLAPLVARDDGAWASGSADVPVVIGVLRPRIVLPSDFDTRYPATQAALVLAHERAHVARGDVPAHLVVALVRCLQWFNPLVHIGARRFRDDQELACDATVLAAHPAARRSYADAMLNTRLAAAGLPVGCHWTSRDAFKERIMLLKQPLPGTLRHRAGRCAVVVLLALSSVAAWAALPATGPATGNSPATSAPSYDNRLLVARFDPRGLEAVLDVTADSLQQLEDGTMDGGMGQRAPLRLESRLADGRRLVLDMRAAHNVWEPAARWQLELDGKVLRSASTPVGVTPVVLDVGALPDGARLPELTVRRNVANRLYAQVSVRQAALQVVGRARYRVGSLEALSMDRTISRFEFSEPALAPEIALQRIAAAAGTGVGIENGEVTFMPLERASATYTGDRRELIDLDMRITVDGRVMTPRLLVRDGETFAVRSSGDDGKDVIEIEGAAHRVSDNLINVAVRLQRNGTSIGTPSITMEEGRTGSVTVGDANDKGVDLTVTPKGNASMPRS